MIIKIIILTLLSSISFLSFSTDERLDFYLKDENIKLAVAQLFVVGYPADLVNYTKCSECDKLINGLKVGGVILNQYNVPEESLVQHERKDAFNIVTGLLGDIRIKSRIGG